MKNNFSISQLFSESLIYFYLLCSIVIITLFLSSYCTISSSEIGLVYQKNQFKKSLTTGLYFLLPKPIEEVIKVPIHTQNIALEKPIDLMCADHQTLRLQTALLTYRFNPLQINHLSNLFQTEKTVDFRPLLQNTVIEQAATLSLDEVMIHNHVFNQLLKQRLQHLCDELNYPIIIENVLSITTLPESLTEAFELKNRAETESDRIKTRAEAWVQKANLQTQNEIALIEQRAHIQSQKIIQNAQEMSENFLQQLSLYEKEPRLYMTRAKNELLYKMRQQATNSTIILDDEKTDLRLLVPRQTEATK